ncbi:bifunctional adenosine 5'-phosphosulfate phosphorylase/adenylylsulfatase HINT4 isoform X2 [Solanum dulcamara]|uniref:bifunctional adenosine 5'-phosphosulfate phosphorylase/adenylylsulfatase HINT4 isoform X2 n=1 Tax=Solanum dulcamara TaxID=45834 RepID=UPI002485B1E9|nr:bifunctional adenosine 5'-phosphosulfate phosphorylase/adenylylsulfatase HINT4 isoform X2 [Solanum dulcamara]
MIRSVTEVGRMTGGALPECIFCQIATSSTSTTLLHYDDKVVAFRDINPSAFRHYLVIPKEHIPTVKNLQRRPEDFSLVSHMLDVGKSLLHRDAPQSKHYSWRFMKYLSLGPLGGFIEVEKLLERIKPQIIHPSSM